VQVSLPSASRPPCLGGRPHKDPSLESLGPAYPVPPDRLEEFHARSGLRIILVRSRHRIQFWSRSTTCRMSGQRWRSSSASAGRRCAVWSPNWRMTLATTLRSANDCASCARAPSKASGCAMRMVSCVCRRGRCASALVCVRWWFGSRHLPSCVNVAQGRSP
jgi:hypothetical protein